ncbi:MAG: glutamine-hydrolyzing carbamoyl-phosphate synthase small subunit [Candidatus Omnitrophica bacterium]|jgi:carbamoyl-phosphate synthase small subunit|nr:glutamine-hydrolyzing carbamoyl-phosphate synthase small subunit [Candidatus Omnitrophota bacterium]
MRAILFLEDGFTLSGESFGTEGEAAGEVVFNTAMTGYQEILTDPSYKGQIVCMTYPLIGNYGVNIADVESKKLRAEGFIVKEKSKIVSNWRANKPLGDYLRENNVVAIEGLDTRALTRRLRDKGSMKGIISTTDFNAKTLKQKLDKTPSIVGVDLVKEVSCSRAYEWEEDLGIRRLDGVEKQKFSVVAIDCGIKYSILRNLKELVEKVIVVPAKTSLSEILKLKPDGILFSNGPGDPEAVTYVIDTAKDLIGKLRNKELKVAVLGVCLGHQILGIAFGGKAKKLKFGHHGGNHPVKDLETGRIDITSQNHNFVIPPETIPDKELFQTHLNLYDRTPEGSRHKKLPVMSVQFHPESGPGPFDARYIFGEFIKLMK